MTSKVQKCKYTLVYIAEGSLFRSDLRKQTTKIQHSVKNISLLIQSRRKIIWRAKNLFVKFQNLGSKQTVQKPPQQDDCAH